MKRLLTIPLALALMGTGACENPFGPEQRVGTPADDEVLDFVSGYCGRENTSCNDLTNLWCLNSETGLAFGITKAYNDDAPQIIVCDEDGVCTCRSGCD